MAALNWAMLTPQGDPVPLPQEKFLWSSPPSSISLSLFPHPPGAPLSIQPHPDTEYTATGGTLYVSQKRILYVAPLPSPPSSSSSPSPAPTPLHSLSVPLRAFLDGRLVQPWFTANYYEALCLEGDKSGGLDTPHLVRFYFKQGGAYDFYSAVEEVKARAAMVDGRHGRGTPVEQLPAYEPPPPPATSSSSPAAAAPPGGTTAPPAAPSPADLAAAHVAAAAEEREQAARERACGVGTRARAAAADGEGEREGEAPPGYEEDEERR